MQTFDHPDYFRRFIPAGSIPSPVALTETKLARDLKRGDLVITDNGEFADVASDTGMIRYRSDQSWSELVPDWPVRVVREITFGLATQGIPIKWLRDDSIRYYGKFDNQCDAYCYEVSLDTFDRAGDMDMGWFASRIDITTVNGTEYPARTDPVLHQWSDYIGSAYPAGYIVSENDRGYVSVRFYESVDELDAAWQKLRDEESRVNEENGEDQ